MMASSFSETPFQYRSSSISSELPRFLSSTLITYDVLLKSIVSSITNIRFSDDDQAWSQATLPF